MQHFRRPVTWLLALHFAVLVLHSSAHVYHGVYPDPVGWFIIVFGYYLLPALGFLRFSWRSAGSFAPVLLGIGAAFVHGLVYHFVLDTPDYVCYFGVHITGLWFSVTAIALAVIDSCIVVASLAGMLFPIR